MPSKRDIARRCAPIIDAILRDLDEKDRAARVNRKRPKVTR